MHECDTAPRIHLKSFKNSLHLSDVSLFYVSQAGTHILQNDVSPTSYILKSRFLSSQILRILIIATPLTHGLITSIL